MKYLVYTAFITMCFAACKSGGENFTVSGKIKSPLAGMVYLEQLSYDSPDTKILDSAKVESDGSYKLQGTSPQQNLFIIGFKDNPSVIFLNDAANIKINFEPGGLQYPDISGSDGSKSLYKFIKDYWQKDSLLSIVYQQLDTLGAEKGKDTFFVKELQQQYTKRYSDLNEVIRNFVSRSNDPAAICFVLDKAKNVIAPNDLTALIDNTAKRFPNHTGVTAFKTALAKESAGGATGGNYALLNQQAPELTMAAPNGKKVSISDYKGKYVLVDFWASWCGPCRQENPNVVTAYDKFKNKNFTILGVSLDNDKQAWLDAIKKDNLGWNHMSDLKQWESAAIPAYGFEGIPFNVLIDPQGKIIAAGLRGPALEQKLSEVLP